MVVFLNPLGTNQEKKRTVSWCLTVLNFSVEFSKYFTLRISKLFYTFYRKVSVLRNACKVLLLFLSADLIFNFKDKNGYLLNNMNSLIQLFSYFDKNILNKNLDDSPQNHNDGTFHYRLLQL